MTESVFVLDIGTTSLKAGLISADGEVVFIFRKKYLNPYAFDVSKREIFRLRQFVFMGMVLQL